LSKFDSYNSFLRKRYKLIILVWFVALLGSLVFVPSFFSSVSYDVANANLGGPSNTESQTAQNIINSQFPPSASAGSGNYSILIVLQNSYVYSDPVKSAIQSIGDVLSSDRNVVNYTGMTSIYSTEADLLNSTGSALLSSTNELAQNVSSINQAEYSLQSNLTALHSQIFQVESGVNETARLVFGVPNTFVTIWQGVRSGGVTDPYQANRIANSTLVNQTGGLGGNTQSQSYYSLFFKAWNSTFSSLANSTSTAVREQYSINQSLGAFASNANLGAQTKAIFSAVGRSLNTTTWNSTVAISDLSKYMIASSIPSNFSASLGISPSSLVDQLYNLGPSPQNTTSSFSNLVINLTINGFGKSNSSSSASFSSSSSFDIGDLVRDSYFLGAKPSSSDVFALASKLSANLTANSFAGSPVFSVNSTALSNFLRQLGEDPNAQSIRNQSNDFVRTNSYGNLPFLPSRALSKNFVSQNNGTMLVILNFASNPDPKTIQSVQSDVKDSNLSSVVNSFYITGSPVITEDVSNAFTPALKITVAPGVGMSILIVGLLFLAPLAALIPILIGGISVAIAYAAIYIGIVEIGKGTPSFLTPTLTTLLMLGLAVDYSVLQLRRTREERLNGNSKEESVAISVRWAGQAVLTAGITVVVAYIVMAVANVPLFSDVGTAIALGVSILLAASLTLLPALELALGDKLFWPFGLRARAKQRESMLERIANHTVRRKIIVAGAITAFALGAFVIAYGTPTGVDFLRLLPNFPSNQGLNVLEANMGSGTISPSEIVVSTSTPIVSGHNQFNQTLLNEIERISLAASNTSGVASVSGPTRPFGSQFNYSGISYMKEPIYSQYLNGMMADIGKNNQTAIIFLGLSDPSQSAQAVSALLKVESSISNLDLPSGIAVHYGGETQGTYDSESFINGILPQVVIILSVAVYFILFLQLRSAFTPLRLVFTILCSVAFSLALLSVVFYFALNLPILDFAPLFVVVTMLGVGIDYDIFFVTRIREEVLKGNTDNSAIKIAISKVWVTIFGLGLVLATVFASLLVTGIAMLQEISLAVASAVIIDVGIVILFFVPALMSLAQRFNWWPSRQVKKRESVGIES